LRLSTMRTVNPQFQLPDPRHYENFPVGSWLLPRHLRPAMAALYQFARYADDVADEGDIPNDQRLAELGALRNALLDFQANLHPIVSPLGQWSELFNREDLLALLEAFEFDVVNGQMADETQLEWYCQRSANPVGHLVLQLFGEAHPRHIAWSDAICTALQQINFLQDLGKDLRRARHYMPYAALSDHQLDTAGLLSSVRQGALNPEQREFIASRAAKAQRLLDSGRPLIGSVPGRLSLELRAIVAGAQTVLERLAASGFDPLLDNCRLRRRDAPRLLWNMMR
jgi:hydroxysqualene synthase